MQGVRIKMDDDYLNPNEELTVPWYRRFIAPFTQTTANAAEEIDIDIEPVHVLRPGEIYTYRGPEYDKDIEPYNYDDDNLEQKIEKIIQQKLSDLLLSHACPICKKQLEE